MVVDETLFADIRAYAEEAVKGAMDTDDKTVRDARLAVVYEDVYNHFDEKYPKEEYQAQIDEAMYKLQKTVVRNWLMYDKKRVDGRGILEIRPALGRGWIASENSRKRSVQQRSDSGIDRCDTWLSR